VFARHFQAPRRSLWCHLRKRVPEGKRLTLQSRLWLALACLLASITTAAAQKQGGTRRVTHRDKPPSASILEEATISTLMPFMAVCNNLVVFDPANRENRLDKILPDLAAAWKLTDEDRTLTFQLRGGVKWHDGKPFTSADVKCTFDILSGKVNGKLRKNPHRTWWFNIKDTTQPPVG
jgi:peptide/nickel transport system substrate-binding protein